jgi:hypothetical protein
MTRRLSSPYSHIAQFRSRFNDSDDQFISYRTSKYKLHYYETPTLLKFVMITDAITDNKRVVLHQIYVSLYVEFVVKNPLREIDGPVGVETFHLALDQFVRTLVYYPSILRLIIGISIDTYIAIYQHLITIVAIIPLTLKFPALITCSTNAA